MNRQILFRGIRTDGKGWVEGDLINLDDRIMIAGVAWWHMAQVTPTKKHWKLSV